MASHDQECFEIIIIQSLRANDIKTGQKLHDELILYKQYSEEFLRRSLYLINTASELFDILETIHQQAMNKGPFPLLHLEMHGNNGCLELSTGEKVMWAQLMPFLRKINIALENKLIIMVAACEGLSLGLRHTIDDRAGFAIIVAPSGKVAQGDMLTAFEHFYDYYLSNADLRGALDAMNKSISDRLVFSLFTAEKFFDMLVNPSSEWVDNQSAELISALKNTYPYAPDWILKIRAKHQINSILETWKEKRNYFLFKD